MSGTDTTHSPAGGWKSAAISNLTVRLLSLLQVDLTAAAATMDSRRALTP